MSQCIRTSESPPNTYPIDTDPSNLDCYSSANHEYGNSLIWGRLIPMSTNWNRNVFDLEYDTYSFGRMATCDVVFSRENMSEDHLKVISKLHFKIWRSHLVSVCVVYLEDASSNGTYVNGEKIGKGRKVPLKNNDIISLALPQVQVFVYADMLIEEVSYPPEIKSRYTVTKELGSGACGKVHLVFEKETSKMLAMKIIHKSKYSSGGINDPKKIKNEIRILRTLYHPCVIQIEDFFDTPDQCFIILALAEGGDLMKYITKKQRLSEKEARKIFYQVVLAVQYLHSKGITHRDLKPQNILLTDHGNDSLIKITDFGLSKTLDSSTRSSSCPCSGSWSDGGGMKSGIMKTVCGSPLYVAPEVISSQNSASSEQPSTGYTHKVDIWSMGVILYLCLSGHPPFLAACKYDGILGHEDDSSHEESCGETVDRRYSLQLAILNGRYSFPKTIWQGISDEAKDLVRRMLTVDPNKRITVENILDHVWLQDQSMRAKVHSLMEKQSSSCLEELRRRAVDSSDFKLCLKRRRLSNDEDDT